MLDFISNTDKETEICHNGVRKIRIRFIHLLIFFDAFGKLPGFFLSIYLLVSPVFLFVEIAFTNLTLKISMK